MIAVSDQDEIEILEAYRRFKNRPFTRMTWEKHENQIRIIELEKVKKVKDLSL